MGISTERESSEYVQLPMPTYSAGSSYIRDALQFSTNLLASITHIQRVGTVSFKKNRLSWQREPKRGLYLLERSEVFIFT